MLPSQAKPSQAKQDNLYPAFSLAAALTCNKETYPTQLYYPFHQYRCVCRYFRYFFRIYPSSTAITDIPSCFAHLMYCNELVAE